MSEFTSNQVNIYHLYMLLCLYFFYAVSNMLFSPFLYYQDGSPPFQNGEEEEEEEEYTPEELLLDSSRYGEDDILEEVIQGGVDLSVQDENGNTALHLAAANGHIRCLALLRDAQAPFMLNDAGNSPLHWAVHLKQEESVQFLLQHFGADVLTRNNFGMSALSEGFDKDHIPILQSLLEHDSAAEEKLVGEMDVKEGDLEPIEIIVDPSIEPISIIQKPITAEEDQILGGSEASKDETGLVVWSAGFYVVFSLSLSLSFKS